MSKDQKRKKSDHAGERIAKVMARVGLCSRRDAEIWIVNGRVSVNGQVLTSAAMNVGTKDIVLVDGKPLPEKQLSRVWLYYKPKGLMTTSYDPEGRATVFDNLPADMPRVISIGRLDLNSEGLLLLTNDGELARKLELPTTAWIRRYRVRVNGRFDPKLLDGLKDGIEIDGVRYGPIIASFDRQQGANAWLNMALTEGKNREIRRICQHFGWPVSRLIRVGYGPFRLGEMEPGQVEEVKGKQLKEQLQFGNDYRHAETAAPEKAAQESENGRTRRERPVFDKGPDKRTRERNMTTEERASRVVRAERPSRPEHGDAPKRNQRPGRNERMAREDGAPPRFERPARGGKPDWGDRPARSDRPGDRPVKPIRPERAGQAGRTERPMRDERSRSSENRTRGEKPSWSRRPEGDEQPMRQERARRNDRGERNEQMARGERPESRERNDASNRAPKTGLKPGWAKNKPAKPQPGTGRKPDRDRPTKDARYARSERPAEGERPRKTFAKPTGERPRGDRPTGDGPKGNRPKGKTGSGNARRFR